MMEFEGISKKEAALILMLQTGLDINDTAKINSVYAKIKEKNMFSSDFAKLYEEELTRLKDGSALNNECISCGNLLSENEFAICDNCLKQLASYAKDELVYEPSEPESADIPTNLEYDNGFANSEIEDIPTKPEPDKKTVSISYDGDEDDFREKYGIDKQKPRRSRISKNERQRTITKLLLIVSAVLLVCVVILSVAFLRMSKKNAEAIENIIKNMSQSNIDMANLPETDSKPSDILDAFASYAEIQGYSLSAGAAGDDGSIIYEITPTNNYLILFYNNDGDLTGVALQMNDTGNEDSQIEQLTLMAFLISSVYDDLNLSQAGEFLEQELIGGDIVVRGSYSWNMAKLEDKVVLMGIDVRYT